MIIPIKSIIKGIAWIWDVLRWFASFVRRLYRRRSKLARISAMRKRLGRLGERLARNVLEEVGMEWLASNYRHGHCEIDLVMRDGVELCFVEVKTRSRLGGYRPAEAVGREKQRNVIRAAHGYMREIGRPKVPCRFDIVEVQFNRGSLFSVNHIRNAFCEITSSIINTGESSCRKRGIRV